MTPPPTSADGAIRKAGTRMLATSTWQNVCGIVKPPSVVAADRYRDNVTGESSRGSHRFGTFSSRTGHEMKTGAVPVLPVLSTWCSSHQTGGMNADSPRYSGYRYPREIISHAVWRYHRFCPRFRNVEDVLAERGIVVFHETIRQWCGKFRPAYVRAAHAPFEVARSSAAVTLRTRGGRNLLRIGRHLMRAKHYRLLRSRAFERWQEVACV
jgi:hypothetical protein